MSLTDTTRADERNAELGQVRGGISGRRDPRTPIPDVAALMAAAIAHGRRALRAKISAAAWLQAAQISSQTDPGEEADAACRRAHAALDAAEADVDLATREVASYQIRANQAGETP